jgi:glycosyltransferase involved in cell wall biosynthesis
MNKYPLVSIALCTYNGEKFLTQQLDTLFAQTYQNLEIIAFDDRSTDNTLSILQGYALKYPNLILYQNVTNLGFLRNFEKALNFCTGEFIAFCDQDDLWDPKKIELQVAAIGDNQLLYHDSEFINEENEPMHKKMSNIFNFYRGDKPEVFLFTNCVSGHAMLIRRDLLKHALPLKDGYYHDWWIAYVAANIGTIDFIPEVLVGYRQHQNSHTDLLDLDEEKNTLARMSKYEKFNWRMKWFKYCASYPENRHPEFVKKFVGLYGDRVNRYVTVELERLLKDNIDVLFFIEKKTRKKKLRIIRKYFWGIKSRNFWYTYLRPNPKKRYHFVEDNR